MVTLPWWCSVRVGPALESDAIEASHRQRALHLVDLENLVRGASPTARDLDWVAAQYREAAGWAGGDLMQVGTSRQAAARSLWRWRYHFPCAWHLGDGPDGGERALLDACPVEYAARFPRIVIGSGDHAFVPLVVDLARRGAQVHVVAPSDALSRQLQLAAAKAVRLTPPPGGVPHIRNTNTA